jgi:hypothetical protein
VKGFTVQKYLYTYSVVATGGPIIYSHDPDRKRAQRLAAAAFDNTGKTFDVRTHRTLNPEYQEA